MGEPRSSTLTCIIICWIISRCSATTDPHNHHETSIFPQQFDYRYTPYADLISEIAVYQDEDIVDYTQLAVDKRHGWLLVGARDSLFKLSLDNLDLVQAVQLSPLDYKKTLCLNVNPKEKCHNYIRVLLLHNYTQINSQSDEDQALYICGTNAFDPLCTWRPLSNLSHILETETGVGKTPYDPSHNSTAIITSAGDFYGATNLGPDDRDPAIYRKEGPHTKSKALRTAQSNSMWLNEPEFVSSYEMGDVVLFFYREVAVEFINCGKRVYSRVARICKSDTGGAFDENIFTSFFKTRLNCSLPGEYPFYFDEIQSTFLLEHGTEKYIYAVFNTPMNSISGSAVCVYNITAFNNSFNGPFKYQETPRSAWERYEQKEQDRMTQCSINQPRDVRSNEIVPNKMTESKYQLMDEAVQPEKFMPLLHAENERWTHIAVDTVNTKHGIIKVLFIATDDGKLRKMAKIPQDSKTGEYCLIEEMKIVPNGDRKPVKALLLSSDKMALFISTQNHILKVPVQRCARFNSRTMCINANDPYCGWDMTLEACTVAPSGQPEVHYWEQPLSDCPVIEYPVDGNWSSWTGWEKCSQVGDDPTSGDCQCRSRTCDNPKPYHGGNPCQGASVQVTNCTAHGQWTDWSTWSSCSQTCGSTAIRQRYRYCSNPPPKFGGRSCIGPDSEEDYCQGHPPCPLPPVKGEWTSWAEWNECSANCNGGIQTRRRACQHPLRAVDTIPCNGNTQEWRMCNIQLCEELQQNTPWTPWIATNHTKGGYFENRYRFTCRAKVPSQTLIKAKHLKTQTRFCFDGGKCHDSGELKSEIDTHSPIDRVLRRYCKHRRRTFRNFCKCRTLGIFLICQKCGYG